MSKQPNTPIEHPVARTNMLQVHWDSESVIRGLMTDSSGGAEVKYQRLPIQRNKGESQEEFYRRVDVDIKRFITTKLGLASTVQNYERVALTKDFVLFFYLGQGASNVEDLITWHKQTGISLSRAISCVLKLKLKISYLDIAARHYDVTLTDSNSDLFIGAREISDNQTNSIVDALKCEVYYSQNDEICLSVHSITFRFDKQHTGLLSTSVGTVAMHKGSTSLLNGTKVSSTVYSDRPYMAFKPSEKQQASAKAHLKGYENSKNYHLTVCLNKIIEILQGVGIDYSPITFQASEVVEDFLTVDIALENELVVIDCFDRYPSAEIKMQFREHLKVAFSASKVIGIEEAPSPHSMKTVGVSYLVINPSSKQNGSSIVVEQNGTALNTFWQALALRLSPKNPWKFDYYTEVKISRFVDELGIVCQGIDVESVSSIEKDGKTVVGELDGNIIKKAKAELWIKESTFHKKRFDFTHCSMGEGEFQVFYARRSEKIHYCSVVDIKIQNGSLQILGTTRWDHESSLIFDRKYPFLKAVTYQRVAGKMIFESLKDQSFILHDKVTGHTLVCYEGIRVPKIIGNCLFDSPERNSKDGIRRFRSGDNNPLPYYLTPKINGQMHRVFVENNGEEGLRYFVASAHAINTTIEKQNLVYTVLVRDRDGQTLDAGAQDITRTFLNSFSYNLLRNNESAKKSVLQKIAEVGMEN